MCTYERSGVEIDQCTQCLGIYLDRGELPRLIDAEAAYFQPQQPVHAPAHR
jgi:Zn-finger nucleic acid-binding protein